MPTKVKGTTGVDKVEAGAVITNPAFSGDATVSGSLTVGGVNVFSGPYRNLIINGNMQLAQRGTSATSLSSNNYFTVDRWKAIHGVGLGVWTNQQSTDVPSGQGFSHSFKSICTTADASPAAGDIVQVIQEIEGQNMVSLKKGTSNAESVTLSFWVKSNVTGTYTIEWRDSDNNRHICAAYTITSSDTWEKKTITFAGDTVSAFVYDNSTCGNIGFCYGAGSNFTSGTLATSWASRNTANLGVGQVNVGAAINNYFQLTGVQLEVGEGASDFEFLPYDVQLQRCQRYYYLHCEGNARAVANGAMYTAAVAYANIKFPVNMRTDPSIEVASATNFRVFAGNGTSNATSVSIWSQGGTTNEYISLSGLSRVQGQACFIDTTNVACKLAFISEL